MKIDSINSVSDSSKSEKIDLQILSFDNRIEFESWLEQNYIDTRGIWVRFFKKG